MKANKRDNFKNIIKQAGNDMLPADFTASVMKAIEAEEARELALKNVLQRHPAEGPSFDFAAGVMARINSKTSAIQYKPIISKKVWYGVAASIALLFGLMFLFRPTGAQASAQPGRIDILIQYITAIPLAYVMALAMIGVLLLADLFLGKQRDKVQIGH